MAADSGANTEISEILKRVGRKFDIIHVQWTDEKLFEAKFRTQIPRDNDDFNALCDEWVDLFSEATNTVWAKKISNTGPKIRFRKQYQCWTQGGKVIQKELLFDARRCKGTLDVKVLTDNPLTRRKNKHIRQGLNVVVKINFVHLHKVDTNQPSSFFVHTCEPQPEPPKPPILPNDRLPQLVAEMVQKGLNATSKVTATQDLMSQRADSPNTQALNQIQRNLSMPPVMNKQTRENGSKPDQAEQTFFDTDDSLIQAQVQLPSIEEQNLHFGPLMPMQNMDAVKLQVQPQLTQVVVAAPQIEMSEPLLMCQPTLMFDPVQVIPVTGLPHHFVQVHPHNVYNQEHYL